MLVNCPKCGFSQPKDKYCANCGVDMESFRPNPPSAWQKLSSNTSVLLGVLALAIFASYFYINSSKNDTASSTPNSGARFLVKNTVSEAGSDSSATNNVNETISNETTEATDENAVVSSAAESTTLTTLAPAEMSGQLAVAAPAEMIAAKDASSLNSREIDAPQQLVKQFQGPGLSISVYFVEVPIATVEQWSKSSRAINETQFQISGNYISGLLNNVSTQMTSPGLKIIHRETGVVSSRSPVLQFFSGVKHRSGDIELDQGIAFYAGLSVTGDNRLAVELDLQKALLENNQMLREAHQASLNPALNQGAFIAMKLPRNFSFEARDYSKSADWFQIFASPSFKANRSDFTVILQLEPKREI